jgi:hypothetical protein
MISRRKSSSLSKETKRRVAGRRLFFFKSDTLEFYCVWMIAPANEWHQHRERRDFFVGRMPSRSRAERVPRTTFVATGAALHGISHAPPDSVNFKSIPFACMADGQMQSMSFSATQIFFEGCFVLK